MTNSVNILVMYSTASPTEEHIQRLETLGDNICVIVARSEQQAIEYASDTEIILGHRYLWQVLPQANCLKWIQSSAAGINHLLVPDLWKLKPLLTRAPIFSDVIAWHGLAMALAQIRGIGTYYHASQKEDSKLDFVPGGVPKTAIVFGLGEIGKTLAKLLLSLGLQVIGVNRSGISEISCHRLSIVSADVWKTYLTEVDFLFICAPLTKDTRQIINAEILDYLPNHSVIINLARGGLIDHSALINQLEQGKIAGASLDVIDTANEQEKAKLQSLPNVIITPKIASFCPDRQKKFENFVELQVKKYLKQEPLLYQVNYLS